MSPQSPTNFFARQERARKAKQKLTIGFVLAVLAIVVATTIATRVVWYIYSYLQAYTLYDTSKAEYYRQVVNGFSLFDPIAFLLVAVAILCLVLAASFYKMYQLKDGGPAVAELLGGVMVKRKTEDPAERRLMNVVEEMSIASGIPLPWVFVMESERNINAFAAGLSLSDATVAVTRGALDQLTRDELQGVVAHEFSHILNGDMRLNVQSISILFGILFLGIVGHQIMKRGRYTVRLGFAVITAGFFLTVIGYIGTFLGRVLQCAIARQQEHMADACAVQFTRNPGGLAGALKKIGGSVFGAQIRSEGARQASHLFFGESHPPHLFTFLSTHPPLGLRIRLLDPSFDGQYPMSVTHDSHKTQPQYTQPYRNVMPTLPPGSPLLGIAAADVIGHVGQPQPEDLETANWQLDGFPGDLTLMLRSPQGAAAAIYALMLSDHRDEQAVQLNILNRALALRDNPVDLDRIRSSIASLKAAEKLGLVEIAMAGLRELTGMEKRNFLIIVDALIAADHHVSLFELTVTWILHQSLDDASKHHTVVKHFNYSQVGLDIVVIISALAKAGHPDDEAKARQAFAEGVRRIDALAKINPNFFIAADASYARVSQALKKLNAASFRIKESVIDAAAHCVFADRHVTAEEKELLRVIALALDSPLPPFPETPPENDRAA